jgi:pSer/pThr/pTyr-binding forkhead associated (FHA) protein
LASDNQEPKKGKKSRGSANRSGSSTGETTEKIYYLVFENSPVQSLVNTRATLDFEASSTISVGRDPNTNTIVIPDPDVSRHHAEFSMDGTRVILKDLGSSNGTYLHDGKEFQELRDSAPVKLKSMIKFGTSTIVKLTRETETQYEH